MNPKVELLAIDGVKLVRADRFSDDRGYFAETYVRRDFAMVGIDHDFMQDNESCSIKPGTIRGLHFQVPPLAQSKLVRVLHGRILDVVVDLRHSSPSYGKHLAIELSDRSCDELFVPAGFAHGFCTLEPSTTVFYKVDQPYSSSHERGVRWSDPGLGIGWPVAADEAVVSEKDRQLPSLRDLPAYF